MPNRPGHLPVDPDTPDRKDPIHQPRKEDHPGADNQDDELPEDDEDTDSEPWWMNSGFKAGAAPRGGRSAPRRPAGAG